jgi:hypothetical protein
MSACALLPAYLPEQGQQEVCVEVALMNLVNNHHLHVWDI